MAQRLQLGQALGLLASALLALGTAGCRVARPAAYPIGLYSVGSVTNLAEIADAGFSLVAGPARLAEAHESGAVAEAERHMQAWVERRLALALGKRVTVTRRAQALRLDPPSL